MRGRRAAEKAGIALAVLALVVVPAVVHGGPRSAVDDVTMALVVAAGLTTIGWREHPRAVAVGGGALWFLACIRLERVITQGFWFPDPALAIMTVLALVAALGWTGRTVVVVAAGLGVYLLTLCWLLAPMSPIALFMFSVPGFVAGTVLRQRWEAADALARRGRELEEERELYADLALRHERARIAAELHDIVGHAISVMVIQAAAGQRLVDRDPVRADQALEAIADSARQGWQDLQRLVDLLGGAPGDDPDLFLVEEVVTNAVRSGLDVSCSFGADRGRLSAPTAHLVFRIVQESLTNALRYAPGCAVHVVVVVGGRAGAVEGRGVTVTVENGRSTGERPGVSGSGRGLTGLRERVQSSGGRMSAGPTAAGGWCVRAELPDRALATP